MHPHPQSRAEPSFNLVSASPNSKYNKPNYALGNPLAFYRDADSQ